MDAAEIKDMVRARYGGIAAAAERESCCAPAASSCCDPAAAASADEKSLRMGDSAA